MSAEPSSNDDDDILLSDEELARPVQDLIRRVRREDGLDRKQADVETDAVAYPGDDAVKMMIGDKSFLQPPKPATDPATFPNM